MEEGRFEETARDILVEMRAEVRHIRQKVDRMTESDEKQWVKLDDHGVKIEGQEKNISHLTWGFRLLMGAVVTLVGGVMVYALTHLP